MDFEAHRLKFEVDVARLIVCHAVQGSTTKGQPRPEIDGAALIPVFSHKHKLVFTGP